MARKREETISQILAVAGVEVRIKELRVASVMVRASISVIVGWEVSRLSCGELCESLVRVVWVLRCSVRW